jgi:hypothetical protein
LSRRGVFAAIESLRVLYVQHNKFFRKDSRGISLAFISNVQGRFSRLLLRDIRWGRYKHSRGVAEKVFIKTKPRTLIKFELKDRVLHKVLAKMLSTKIEPYLADSLHSYRKDKSWWDPVSQFAEYVRKYRKAIPDKKKQGLYVLRTDIKSYSDSIPLHVSSRLWSILKDVLKENGRLDEGLFELFQKSMRPVIKPKKKSPYTPLYGVPFGSPLCVLADNLYLKDLDFELQELNNEAFYARYGDDIIYAHPSYDAVKLAEAKIHLRLAENELRVGEKKHRIFSFNNCGKFDSGLPDTKGTSIIKFLGVVIDFDSIVSLKFSEFRALKKIIAVRLKNFQRCLPAADNKNVAKELCTFADKLLNPSWEYSLTVSSMLKCCITSRNQLKELDLYVADTIARLLSGKNSKAAFKEYPYRVLREEYKLRSLCYSRNLNTAWNG